MYIDEESNKLFLIKIKIKWLKGTLIHTVALRNSFLNVMIGKTDQFFLFFVSHRLKVITRSTVTVFFKEQNSLHAIHKQKGLVNKK